MTTCLVVGAGDGIGAAVARRFAHDGCSIGLVARDVARLERVAAGLGEGTQVASADAAETDDLARALADLQNALGPADILVYNVAMAADGAAGNLTPEALRRALAVDVVGAVAATQAVLPAMRERHDGSLLFTGGGLALYPAAQFAALSIGKAALRAWALALHDDLSPLGIHAATVTVAGLVAAGTAFDPDVIAACFAELHEQPRSEWEAERIFRG